MGKEQPAQQPPDLGKAAETLATQVGPEAAADPERVATVAEHIAELQQLLNQRNPGQET